MKKIFKIAKLELSLLFYSPIAWLILIIFTLQSGFTFFELVDARQTNQQLGRELKGLTMDIFGGGRGFFASVQNTLYLYIPLLTMGLMSRELSSGSIKLLYSSPVTSAQIVLGKFLSMMLYGLLLVGVLLLIVLMAGISVEALDIKYLMGGILGLYLLICAYSAIGLFMSSLTSYQVVAAISTLAVLAALSYVGTVGQSIDFVREITYWISIDGRADNYMNGLISSKDSIYFLLVIGTFLLLTIMRLNSGRLNTSSTFNTLRYVGLVVVVLAIGYFSSLPALNGYYDTTRFKDKTLTTNSQEILRKLEEPIKITSYVNVLNSFAHLGSPKWRLFDLRQFDQYTRFLPELKITHVPYYDDPMNGRVDSNMTLEEQAQRAATAYGFDFEYILAPEEIQREIDLIPEENLFVRTVEYQGRKTNLRMFYDMYTYPHEAEISAAIKRLLQPSPVVGVLSGNDERSIDRTGDKDYKSITNTLTSRGALINQGFDVIEVPLEKEIPSDLTVLVIADPIGEYSQGELYKLHQYIEAGGNVIIAGEPGKQELLNPLLSPLGITFKKGILLQQSKDLELDLIQARASEQAADFGLDFQQKEIISFSGAMGINMSDSSAFELTPVLETREGQVWNRTDEFNLETEEISFREGTDQKEVLPVGVALTRNISDKEQKIMVFGDADFMSNGELGRFNLSTRNYEFTIGVFKWFSDYEFPIDTSRPEPIDNTILVDQTDLAWMERLFLGLLPLGIGLTGSITLIRRKRK